MSVKKEKLIKITKDEDGSEVRVYKEFDQDNPYLTSGLRFFDKNNPAFLGIEYNTVKKCYFLMSE